MRCGNSRCDLPGSRSDEEARFEASSKRMRQPRVTCKLPSGRKPESPCWAYPRARSQSYNEALNHAQEATVRTGTHGEPFGELGELPFSLHREVVIGSLGLGLDLGIASANSSACLPASFLTRSGAARQSRSAVCLGRRRSLRLPSPGLYWDRSRSGFQFPKFSGTFL
jgi:hypothetical protein